MDRLKALVKRRLPESQVRHLRRWLQRWRAWRERDTAKLGYTVSDLRHASRQLWAGHSKTAASVLRQIMETQGAPRSHRARAAFQLAKLAASNEEWATAREFLGEATLRGLDGDDQARGYILKAASAMHEGWTDQARAALEARAIGRVGQNHQKLMQSNLAYWRLLWGEASDREAVDAERLALLNRIYREEGLMEVGKRERSRPLSLANIAPAGASPSHQGVGLKVSVLMPCFNAAETIGFAIDSVLEQTYHNVEVICSDDRSTDSTREIIQSYVDAGRPVRLLVNEQNSGPYYGRNRALEQAWGEFVTVQDADDWMHPQRIEVQMAYLRSKRGLRFSFTRLARVADEFLFTLRPFRPMLEPIHWNYTSILGAKESFVEMGGWDSVVAHADAEFIDRVKDRWGEHVLGECYANVPLALFTDGAGNLTKRAGTGLTSVGFGARREYQEQARFWRHDRKPGLPVRGVVRRENGREPFFVPNALLAPHMQRDTAYDFVFITDMSLLGGTRRCNLEYFRICVERGWRVAVFNYPRYRGRRVGSIDDEYRRCFDRGEVDLLTPEERVEAHCVIVHHPPIIDAPIDAYPAIATDNVAVLVNQLPYQSRQADARPLYDPERVAGDLAEAFGVRPWWVPISGLVSQELVGFVDAASVWPETWYPVVDWVRRDRAEGQRDTGAGGNKIRVGRHSRDDATKWPDSAELLQQVYPQAPDIEVRILGGADNVCGGLVKLPSNWTVYSFDAVDVGEFLSGLDVFVHWTRSDYIEEFGRNVAEAMACGVPCIVSRDLEPTFGDAALYPEASAVEETVRRLASDRALREDMIAKGRAFVAQHCSMAVAGTRMARLRNREADAAAGSSAEAAAGASRPQVSA